MARFILTGKSSIALCGVSNTTNTGATESQGRLCDENGVVNHLLFLDDLKLTIDHLPFVIPQADVDRDRLYIWSEGGCEMISIEQYVNVEINSLNKYLVGSQERMLKAVCREKVIKGNDSGMDKASYLDERARKYQGKPPPQIIR